jgi:hypothetical protein
VLGIGSFTYQYNTRDTFGFAMKATYVEVNGEGREIFKDPITDDGTKKSATGLLFVGRGDNSGELRLFDKVTWETESKGQLKTLYRDGKFYMNTTLTQIKEKLKEISRDKAYKVMETLLSKRNTTDIIKRNLPTIEEIKNKEILLLDKLTKIAETIKDVMNEEEKNVIMSYFAEKIK